MTQHLIIHGVMPDLNTLLDARGRVYRPGRRGRRTDAYTAIKRRWEQQVAQECRAQSIRPVLGPVLLEFLWYEPSRRRDPDNVAAGGRKLILDGLVRAGILQGDGWRYIYGWTDTFDVDRTQPRVHLVLVALDPQPNAAQE